MPISLYERAQLARQKRFLERLAVALAIAATNISSAIRAGNNPRQDDKEQLQLANRILVRPGDFAADLAFSVVGNMQLESSVEEAPNNAGPTDAKIADAVGGLFPAWAVPTKYGLDSMAADPNAPQSAPISSSAKSTSTTGATAGVTLSTTK